VKYRRHRLHGLLDTGSDITVAGNNLAKKFKWETCPHPTKSVKIANSEEMVIYGAVYVSLRVSKKGIDFEILISPDITGLIIGIDWMKKQGYIWDFRQQRIMIEDREWLELKPAHDASGIRRIYVGEDTLLPPSQQTEVNVRVERRAPQSLAFTGLLENDEVSDLHHVYTARSFIPAKFTGIKVPVLNTEKRSQVIAKDTDLGEVQVVEVIDEVKNVEENPTKSLSPLEKDAIDKILEKMPEDMTEEQRQKVQDLLVKYRNFISTGDHDIGRTDLVEYRIDTGDSRPIRQPLRRYHFQHLDWIDKEVEEMKKHGIVEPAASPWASNVVLVKKKDGTLRFCIDCRRLNSVTKQDSYPLLLIDNCLNALSGSSWYSTLDLRSGY